VCSTASPARSDRDRGQSTVELALCLPLLCLLLLGVVQVAVVAADHLAAAEAARIGARAAAVAADPAGAATAAVRAAGFDGDDVRTTVAGDIVTVTVSRTNQTDVALIGALLPDVHVSATAAMLLEPP
jgi:hypothetical protein